LGKYQFILSQIGLIGSDETASAITILLFFAVGMIAGITLFSRFLSWLLVRFHKPTLCVLIGFLIGSLTVIWPYQSRSYEETVRTSVVPYMDAKVQETLKYPVSASEKPEFYRIQKVLSEDLSEDERQVVLEKVKMKLIHSEPFLPSLNNADSDSRLKDGTTSLVWGFVSMLIGLVLVVGIEKLADKEE
jgi:putative membrane protein